MRDTYATITYERQKGWAEGRAEGIAEGKQEGIASVVRNMLQRGMPTEDVCKFTRLSREEVESLE